MIQKMIRRWIVFYFAFGSLFAQSLSIQEEKAAMKRTQSLIDEQKFSEFFTHCTENLTQHQISALFYYTCGKYSLYFAQPDRSREIISQSYRWLMAAAHIFKKSGKQHFYYSDALLYAALACQFMNDLDRAKSIYREIISRDNRVTTAWYNLGVISELQGNADESLRAFDRYLILTDASLKSDF